MKGVVIMREELLIEREFIKHQMRLLMVDFLKETDKDKGLEILSTIKNLSKRIEAINCKLAHKQLIDMFKRA
jgi:3-hydroxymyristoyl/3-hydroxydecanoyl-(acyl carrier protein) dehydratase